MVPEDFLLILFNIVDGLAYEGETGIQSFDFSCYFMEGEKFAAMEG